MTFPQKFLSGDVYVSYGSWTVNLVLHGYWRSSASYRVRIGLNLKGLAYRQVTHDLRVGDQSLPAFRELAPLGLVPALEADGKVITQSLAILEWLDECCPAPRLLPDIALDRAVVRSMAAVIASDVHPLNNLRVLKYLRADLGAIDDAVQDWIARWTMAGFEALETMVVQHGAGFCFGATPTLADCCLVPQIYNARRFGVDLIRYPALLAIDEACMKLAAFQNAAPQAQPDADGAAI